MESVKLRGIAGLMLLFAHCSIPAVAAESWRAIPTSARNVLFAVDDASLVREGDIVKFWERLVYVAPIKRDEATGKLIKEKRVKRVMNCAERTQGYLYGALIAEDGRRIEAVTAEMSEVRMTAIPANTLAEKELAWACAAR